MRKTFSVAAAMLMLAVCVSCTSNVAIVKEHREKGYTMPMNGTEAELTERAVKMLSKDYSVERVEHGIIASASDSKAVIGIFFYSDTGQASSVRVEVLIAGSKYSGTFERAIWKNLNEYKSK